MAKEAKIDIKVSTREAIRATKNMSKAMRQFRASVFKSKKQLKSFGKDLKKNFSDRFVITAGDVVGALGRAGQAIFEFTKEAGKFQEVRTAFRGLAEANGNDADEILANMRRLSAGTINDMTLMQQANQAALLGLPVDRFGEMLTIARSSAKATGQSMDFMLESIVTGLGRGSKLMLDNLGILINTQKAYDDYAKTLGKSSAALTDAEKKQAFINEALRIGTANAKKAGIGQESLTDQIAQFETNIKNAALALGETLAPALKATFFGLSESAKFIGGLFKSDEPKKNIESIDAEIQKLETTIDSLKKREKANPLAFRFMGDKRNLEQATKDFGELLAVRSKMQAEIDQKNAQARARERAANEEQRQARLEGLSKEQEALIEAKEQELAFIGLSDEQKIQQQIKLADAEIKNAATKEEKLAALKEKAAFTDALIEEKKRLELKKIDQKKEQDRAATLSTIATLQNSNNKTLATIGKAAALTQIAIEGPIAVTRALSAFPPPINFIAAAAVGAAVAAQAAQVAGVALQDGGIVPATPGGIQATIGEGGRDEAVIPLPEEFDPDEGGIGGNISITVNGGMLGDASSAREFALAVDEELTKLRQNNESNAFDQDII